MRAQYATEQLSRGIETLAVYGLQHRLHQRDADCMFEV